MLLRLGVDDYLRFPGVFSISEAFPFHLVFFCALYSCSAHQSIPFALLCTFVTRVAHTASTSQGTYANHSVTAARMFGSGHLALHLSRHLALHLSRLLAILIVALRNDDRHSPGWMLGVVLLQEFLT